jgi:hypothetical protein
MELKKLFQETFPEYYNVNSKKETHIYLSTALEEIKETIARIEEHRIENMTEGNFDIAEGLEMAKKEMYFMNIGMIQKQLKK